MYYYEPMKKETLTVEENNLGAVTYSNSNGELHNPYGPAVVGTDGYKEHRINDQLHNPNGPAMVWADGHKEHWINGKLHNPNGPAVVWKDGYKAYYINDKKLTEAEFKTWQAQQTAPLHNKIATIDGIEYTLTAK
jgi:hypothetical protein